MRNKKRNDGMFSGWYTVVIKFKDGQSIVLQKVLIDNDKYWSGILRLIDEDMKEYQYLISTLKKWQYGPVTNRELRK